MDEYVGIAEDHPESYHRLEVGIMFCYYIISDLNFVQVHV